MMRRFRSGYDHADVQPRDFLPELRRELARGAPKDQILLCFTCDPYPKVELKHGFTRATLELLNEFGCAVAILSKSGRLLLRDLELFKAFKGRIKVGATLTFSSKADSKKWEPGAALPEERLSALRELHEAGIKTFASFEPVLDPLQSLGLMKAALPFVDQFKVGKLNHHPLAKEINWPNFLVESLKILRPSRKAFYIKKDLREFAPAGLKLSEAEADQDALARTLRSDSDVVGLHESGKRDYRSRLML
ncbi:MAG: hypothetical protein NTY77_01895 [Elusimicrobia bacterium]|nr:hypothetical protein [Elusimicrobiota bacterium]